MSSSLIHRLRKWSSQQIFIVFAAFLVYVLADGTTFSFGLYVDQLISEYSTSKSKTVVITSTLAALTQSVPLLLSPLVCWWTTKFGASSASLIGCILSASGYILPFVLQFYKTFWISAIGYGCLLSVGLAFCYVPAYLTLPYYFEDDRGLATGLAVSGSGVGQVALAIIVKACMLEYGWRGASLITGGLFFLMLISVVAFRQSPSCSTPISTLPPVETELSEFSAIPAVTVTISEERSREEEKSMEQSNPRRIRSSTIAQVLPHFISSVPVRTSINLQSLNSPNVRRHSLNLRPRFCTLSTERPMNKNIVIKNWKRTRSNTIAVPVQRGQQIDRSSERIQIPLRPYQLAPIASVDENSDEERMSSSSSSSLQTPEQIGIIEQTSTEKHWLLNRRFILFCLSNFALCLVMGVPYVIIPRYISETFLDQGYLASWTLSNVGIASALGQILLGYLHDRKVFSAWLMYTFAVIVSGASLVILALFQYRLVVLICAFMYGLAISANYALQVLIVIDALSIDNMANAFGVLQFCQGVSTLIGIPLQGLLRDLSHTYKLSFLTSGVIIILSGLGMFFWPCLSTTNKKKINDIDNDK